MGFRFDKYYFDVVTENGDVGVVYVASSRVAGLTTHHAGLELYPVNQPMVVFRGRAEPPDFVGLDGSSGGNIRIVFPEGEAEFRISDPKPSLIPDYPDSDGPITWSVVYPTAQIQLAIQADSFTGELKGRGYADRVVLGQIPRRLGLRRLDWGRLLTPDGAIVFNILRVTGGKTAYLRSILTGSKWEITRDPCVVATSKTGTVVTWRDMVLRLDTVRCLHDGSGFNRDRIPGLTEKWMMRAIGGKIQESRFLAHGSIQGSQVKGSAVHETVFFGKKVI